LASPSLALACALRLQRRADPARRVILTERGNFPTDLYIAQGLIDLSGGGHQGKYREVT
jgi:kynureninase